MSDYPQGNIFTKELGVGGTGGTAFVDCNALSERPPLVQTLLFWRDDVCIRGVQVKFTDGTTSSVHGTSTGSSTSFTLAPGEFLIKANLRANQAKNRLGEVEFTTNLGNVFNYGVSNLDSLIVNPDVGSGLLVGISGRSGLDVDALSLVFFVAVDNLAITDIAPATPTTGPYDVVVGRDQYTNPDDTPRDVNVVGSVQLPITTSFETKNPVQYATATVLLNNPKAFELAPSGSAQPWNPVIIAGAVEETLVKVVRIDWEEKVTVPPKTTVTLNAICELGVAKVDFAGATVTVFFKNQATYKYTDSGILTQNRYIPLHPVKTVDPATGVAAVIKARVYVV